MTTTLTRWVERLGQFSTTKTGIGLLFVIALATRFVGVYLGGSGGNRGDDDGMLLGLTLNFIQGKGFSMYWEGFGPNFCFLPPGLPIFHLLFIKIFSAHFLIAERYFFLLMSAVTNVAFLFLLRKYFSAGVAYIGALWLALYPPQWFWSTRINSHTYATNMLVIGLLTLLIAWEKRSLLWGFITGLIWASMGLTRPEYLLGIFCLSAATVFVSNLQGMRWRFIGVMLSGWVLLISPWVIRNYLITGRLVLSSTHYSYNFWMVYNEAYTYEGINFPMPEHLKEALRNAPKEMDRVDIWVAEGMRFIRQQPKLALQRTVYNFLNFWRPWLSRKATSWLENGVYVVSWVPIFVLFLVGLFQMRWLDPRWMAVWSFMLYKMLAQIPFYMIVRFREAILPLFVLIALIPIARWLDHPTPSDRFTK